MSAFANSSAAQPAPAAPEPAPKQPAARSRSTWIVIALILIAAGAAWMLRPRASSKPASASVTVRTMKVAPGRLQQTTRLTGATTAGNFANITMPMLRGPDAGRSLTLIYLAKSGSFVKKGEIVAQVDGQAQKDHIDDVDAMVTAAEADIRKAKAEQEIELETLRQTLRLAKANLDKFRLDAQASEVRTTIDQELLKLSVEESQAQYNELQKDFNTVVARQKSEIRLLELTRDRHMRHRDRHKGDLERFTIHASMPGLVVMQSVYRGGDMGQIQVGDQVSPGQPFMKVVDPASMRVDASINQAESERIRLGQPATITFDAFPGLKLPGKVYAIGALAVGGWRQNYYIRNVPVRVSILGQDSRVIPDLSAGADVVIGEDTEGLVVPREALHEANGKPVVYVKGPSGFEAREVEVASRNNTHAAVKSGLKAGEEIALQPPAVLSASR